MLPLILIFTLSVIAAAVCYRRFDAMSYTRDLGAPVRAIALPSPRRHSINREVTHARRWTLRSSRARHRYCFHAVPLA